MIYNLEHHMVNGESSEVNLASLRAFIVQVEHYHGHPWRARQKGSRMTPNCLRVLKSWHYALLSGLANERFDFQGHATRSITLTIPSMKES